MERTRGTLLLLLLYVGASQQQQPGSHCEQYQTVSHQTPCTSCAASPSIRCPPGYSRPSSASPCRYVVQIGSREVELEGCHHICVKAITQSQCCPEHWGPLCLPCPSWSGKTCNFHGTCLDGGLGNGTCVCDRGFSGVSCQNCLNQNAYGPSCDKECDCMNGLCSKGPDGSGACLCQPPYSGARCNHVSDHCRNCSAYSYCGGSGEQASCVCLPGHRKSPTVNTCISACTARECHPNADCSSVGSKVQCACKPGYHGDGKICLPINPCSVDNGGCPRNSTVCVFQGPNKSSCECMLGMAPIGSTPKLGCVLISACSLDTCDTTAVCETGLDGQPRCVCKPDQIGDGRRCYGNVLDRILELDRRGDQTGKLSGAVILFDRGCQLSLSREGPFTALIPLLETPLPNVDEKRVCENHLILGQHLLIELEGRDLNLFGGATARFKGNKRFIITSDPNRIYTVVQADLPAANGIIHIIDRPITSLLPDAPHDLKFSDKTIAEVMTLDERFNRFLSLTDNCGAPLPLRGPGPLTVFIPTNQAVDRARDGSIMYMITDAKHKLQELVKHHMYSHAALSAGQLATLPQIETLANQIIRITIGDDGKVLLGEKSVPMETTNIVASNGIIHMVGGLLVPPSILPILPHRCDVIENKISMVAECCKGFYGPDCKPCIGGFQDPCYGRGACSDGIHGNGTCICEPNFKGVACHICSDPNKHGENCDQDCACVHGLCDNHPDSGGVCRRGSCLEGFSGELCDQRASPCNSDGLHRHCHLHAYCVLSGEHTDCVCKVGFEGDGLSCSLVNFCLKSDRGGCDLNAQCVFVAPANVSCVCTEGWTGDGSVCVEINNCELPSRGGCSPNAECRHIGPAQSECRCKSSYLGDGVTCELVNPCSKDNGGCHTLATCDFKEGVHTCTCSEGFSGDGHICYGTLSDELDMSRMYGFTRLIQSDRTSSEYMSGNLTVLVPSRETWLNFTLAQEHFWMRRHRLSHFLRAHMLPGFYTVEVLEGLVGSSLLSLTPPTCWPITKVNGSIHIGTASILTPDLPASNGYIHIIDMILAPPLSDLGPEPPTLMEFLNLTSNFTLFRQHALMYNLTEYLRMLDFTIMLPTDDAIRQHLKTTNSTLLDPSVFKYHVVKEVLFPADLRDGMIKDTLLGHDYQLQFHLKNNQTLVNNVLLDNHYVETQSGVLHVLSQVLKVQKNRCSRMVTLQVNGRCSECNGPPQCSYNYQPIRSQFPDNMVSNCRFRKRVGPRRKSVAGCVIKCLRVTRDHTCCPGYYGHECFKCPGEEGSWCSNHGQCQDGNHGNGECHCYEGFHGTACEDCEPGRYGTNCSSKCVCEHGKCEDGLTGRGICLCLKGWKGASCSVEIKDDVCGGVCDENANCITGPQGTNPVCLCAVGYQGNGTSCTEMDVCSWQNGGCSQFAVCTKASAGERTCACRDGYTGDGVVCLEVDGCLLNNGGCDMNAECTRTGPKTTACSCLPGFSGSGHYCSYINPCTTGKGGCDHFATCRYLGQGQRNCSCMRGYIGDGFNCRGSTNNEMRLRPINQFFNGMMSMSLFRFPKGPLTVFVPDKTANADFPVLEWRSLGLGRQLIQTHIVSCEVLSFSDLTTTSQAVAISGRTLEFTQRQGEVYINNRSRIISSDSTTDGIIHYVDKVLTALSLLNHTAPKTNMDFTKAAGLYGYSRFSRLINVSGLLPVLQMTSLQPFLMLWPSDAALQRLPVARQRWLEDPEHRTQLQDILKAHIVRKTMILFDSAVRSLHGSKITFNCDKKLVGEILVNGNSARVVDRFLSFREGVAHGIDQLLEPPGLGAHCDGTENRTVNSPCGDCLNARPCPFGTVDTGRTEWCYSPLNRRMRGYSKHRSPWMVDFTFNACKRICNQVIWRPKCCKNHYGPDCQVCPGGLEAPCGNHGDCTPTTGICICNKGFRGAACGLCETNHYGLNCTACECSNGKCEDGVEGSGECICESGWSGKQCQKKVDGSAEQCRLCHVDAVCLPSGGCLCKEPFEGNGTHCSPLPVPDLCSEYNGGCDRNADCNQTGSVTNCSCHSGYHGDGYSCNPINRCIDELNGGCSDFATCKFTGPNQRQCECVPGFVGNGVQCLEIVVPPVDRCLEDNGGCDPRAACKDLHYHASTGGVFHLRSAEGKYKMNLSEAQSACSAQDATLASFKQLADAQQLGMHLCVAGWMEGGRVGYPTRSPSPRCGDGHVGVVLYQEPVDPASKYDAYCYRYTEVSCVCNSVYVGDGEFCNGDVSDVIATQTNFSLFYKSLLDYSKSSVKGRELLDFLSYRKSDIMVFVPHNSGFSANQTLSGRDLEYHVSANHSRRLYQELQHQQSILTWLGCNLTVTHGNNLTVTHGNNQSYKLVNRRLLLNWDVPAVNGIIHVIQAPLRAPPPQVQTPASLSSPSSTSVSVTLVVLLLGVLGAGGGGYYLRHQKNPFTFHSFKNEEAVPASVMSVNNPLYSELTTHGQPFTDSGHRTALEEPSRMEDVVQ